MNSCKAIQILPNPQVSKTTVNVNIHSSEIQKEYSSCQTCQQQPSRNYPLPPIPPPLPPTYPPQYYGSPYLYNNNYFPQPPIIPDNYRFYYLPYNNNPCYNSCPIRNYCQPMSCPPMCYNPCANPCNYY
jgi:hypothetical protein